MEEEARKNLSELREKTDEFTFVSKNLGKGMNKIEFSKVLCLGMEIKGKYECECATENGYEYLGLLPKYQKVGSQRLTFDKKPSNSEIIRELEKIKNKVFFSY